MKRRRWLQSGSVQLSLTLARHSPLPVAPLQSVISWLLPQLPAAPTALKKQSKAVPVPAWSCLLRAVDHAGDGAALGDRFSLQIGRPDHWTVEMQLLKGSQTSSGAADAVWWTALSASAVRRQAV